MLMTGRKSMKVSIRTALVAILTVVAGVGLALAAGIQDQKVSPGIKIPGTGSPIQKELTKPPIKLPALEAVGTGAAFAPPGTYQGVTGGLEGTGWVLLSGLSCPGFLGQFN
jgi:hypothetical protein